MGSIPSELVLDLKLPLAMKTITGFLKEVSAIGDGEGRVTKLEEFVKSLEEEKRKIEAFKRELPLCMVLLNNVIEGLKEDLAHCRSGGNGNACPVLEEFMPIKSKFEEEKGAELEKDHRDKMNWMSSAQLWSDNYNNNNNNTNNNSNKNTKERAEEPDRRPENENPFVECKYRSGGGAFLPFKGFSGFPASARKEEKAAVSLPDLSLVSPAIKNSHPVSVVPEEHRSTGSSSKGGGRAPLSSSANSQLNLQAQQQASRKARRCWSPELHRRFVSALQQLGGSQAATPKQIRELMKVDGLTNDEVKSHLQKYRLHAQRPSNSSTPANQSVVVMGGLWVPQDHYSSSKQSASQSGSPQGPLQLAGAARGISVTGGDSCEEEDGKSESYSWKGHNQRSGEEEID